LPVSRAGQLPRPRLPGPGRIAALAVREPFSSGRLPAISRRRGTLAITFLPDRTIEVSADEASGLIRNGKLAGTPR